MKYVADYNVFEDYEPGFEPQMYYHTDENGIEWGFCEEVSEEYNKEHMRTYVEFLVLDTEDPDFYKVICNLDYDKWVSGEWRNDERYTDGYEIDSSIRRGVTNVVTPREIANSDEPFADESEVVDKYIQNIGTYGLLSAEEEQELLARAVRGDIEAFDKVLYANLRFTVSVANQYQNKGLSLLKLFEISLQGLAHAINESPSKPKDEKFIKFAVPFMRQAIEKAISDFEDRSQE